MKSEPTFKLSSGGQSLQKTKDRNVLDRLRRLTILSIMFLIAGSGITQDIDNWTMSYGPNFRDFNAVQILPDARIIAVGGNQSNDALTTITYSEDLGETWNISVDLINAWLQDVHFPTQSTGYSVGW